MVFDMPHRLLLMLCFLTALEVMELFCKMCDNGIAVFPLLVLILIFLILIFLIFLILIFLILIFLFLLFPGWRWWRW
jgi:hypothetical protein